MKLGKKQAVYGAVLGAAAVAFVVDRVCFSPESAGAETAPRTVEKSAANEPTAEKPAVASATAPSIPAGWLGQRLRASTAGSDVPSRDVFALPACWRPAPKAAATTVAPPVAPKPQLFGDIFRRDHHLMAVMIETGGGRAVVDGKLISLGSSIDGFRLVSLSAQSARFVHGGEQVSLSIADSGNSIGK